jgi:hypothetical protein
VGIKEITKEVEECSALSLGGVQSVLSNMVEILPLFLKFGQSVNLEGVTFEVENLDATARPMI